MKKLCFHFLSLTMIVWVCTFATSCKEDPPPSKRGILIGKTWTAIKYEMDGVDVTDDRDECEIDNTTTFFDNGTYLDDAGAVLCDEGEPDTDGSWTFKANETVISMQPSGEPESDWNIQELTDNTFRVSQYNQFLQAELTITMAPVQ